MDSPNKKQRRGIKNLEKIERIINREFQNELNLREKQLELIQQRINQAQKTLHILRYVIVSTYYNNANKNVTNPPAENTKTNETTPQRLHPAIKKLLSGFTPESNLTKSRRIKQISVPESNTSINKHVEAIQPKQEPLVVTPEERTEPVAVCNNTEYSENYKIIRNRKKKAYIVVVGNISKWTPTECEEDKSTHKWMVYVRGPKTNPDISNFVQKVVFHLHPSYKPNDVVEIKDQPFHLSRRGWGEFPLRVRIHFVHTANKPVDIVHQLKLDKTFTGRQTLGNETIVNLQLYTNGDCIKSETIVKEEHNTDSNYLEHDYCHSEINEKPAERDDSIVSLEHSYCSRTAVTTTTKEIVQPDNQLIYGLQYDNSECIQPVLQEESVVESDAIDVQKTSPKLATKNVTSSPKKRKLQDPLPTQQLAKKQCLYDTNIDCSKFQLDITKRRYKNVLQILPFLFKHLPIITKLARNTTYKCTYPYVAATLEEYSSWNIGKRLSSEWFQAKTILHIITTNQIPDCRNWTTKSVIMYARAHGYTPLANYSIFKGKNSDYVYDYIPNGEMIEEIKQVIEPNDEIVEVAEIIKAPTKPEKYTKVTQLIDLNLQKASSFIKHAVLDVGVILKPEEIVPGILFSAAERVILQAVLCLAEDLIRKARAKLVIQGNFKEESSIITIDHICEILASRSEFNFLLQSDTG